MGFINQLYYTKLNNVHDRSGVGAIGQAVRGERGFMTKQLNVVAHKIKLFKAPLPPPRYAKRYPLGRRKTFVYPAPCSGQGNAHQEIALTESSVEF